MTTATAEPRADSKPMEPFQLFPEPDFGDFPQCPECERPVNREHFAQQDYRKSKQWITLLYCDHCGITYETIWEFHHGGWKVYGSVRSDGEKVPPVLERIRELTCADA